MGNLAMSDLLGHPEEQDRIEADVPHHGRTVESRRLPLLTHRWLFVDIEKDLAKIHTTDPLPADTETMIEALVVTVTEGAREVVEIVVEIAAEDIGAGMMIEHAVDPSHHQSSLDTRIPSFMV